MTVKKKATKPSTSRIDEVISRGGKVIADSKPQIVEKEVKFTLRVPKGLLLKIDRARKSKVGVVSRNQWILEALEEACSN